MRVILASLASLRAQKPLCESRSSAGLCSTPWGLPWVPSDVAPYRRVRSDAVREQLAVTSYGGSGRAVSQRSVAGGLQNMRQARVQRNCRVV